MSMTDITTALSQYLERTGPVLSIDIGSGTQDALLAIPGEHPENWSRFVLPAPARMVARRIRQLTEAKRPVWLYGHTMGGGFAAALREQLSTGLIPAASPEAALALHDDVERVRQQGIRLESTCPAGYTPVFLSDYSAAFWEGLLAASGLPFPAQVVAAVQDHGWQPDATIGNREGRFQIWRDVLLRSGGNPIPWVYATPPASCTRLAALQRQTGGPVADTATAAVLGTLMAPEVMLRSQRQGVTLVNVGNSHISAFLVYRGQVFGIYEHHTGLLDTDALLFDLKEFSFGWLPDEQVRAKGGHGCIFSGALPPEAEGFAPVFAVGPRRELLRGHAQFIAPYGDMMLTGCHGLLSGLALSESF